VIARETTYSQLEIDSFALHFMVDTTTFNPSVKVKGDWLQTPLGN